MTVFELQDSTPVPPGRRIQLADGREGVLIWEYEPKGGQGTDRLEAIGIRVSVLYHAENRRRYVTSIFSIETSPQAIERREELILEAANEDSRTCSGSRPPGGVGENSERAPDGVGEYRPQADCTSLA